MTSCGKAKQGTILANSLRFAQRCRELLTIESGKNPKVLKLMSPRLQDEVLLASAQRKSPAKLFTMQAASSRSMLSGLSGRSRILQFLKKLV